MSSIDKRVVEMQFNNQNFESNVSTSLKSLENLKNSLKFDGAGKGLDDLERSFGQVSFDHLVDSVDNISNKFSMLGIIGITALQNIANTAISTGTQLIKSLSIDQLAAGFTKYEQKTASVQTIMNATGKTVDEVSGYLDKLMWFSDETSYGFTDMTAALAQMTSTGGNIDNLIPLITGVANATAYAGKGAAEFSRAMYNLNQSYGSGNLQYMDWRSLELAGVASQQLKQIFIDTGIELGHLNSEGKTAKGTLVDIGTFGTTLSEKWANTEVMEKAFGKFSELSEAAYLMVQAGEAETAAEAMEKLTGVYSEVAEKAFKSAQQAKSFTEAIEATKDAVSSGWMKTFELIFGNLEEATILWTDVTNVLWEVFAASSEARNEMFESWKELGGRTDLIDSVSSAFSGLASVFAPVKEAFRDIFPAMTAEKLFSITEALKDFTSGLTVSDETAENIKRTFKGVFAALDIGKEVAYKVLEVMKEIAAIILPISGRLLAFTANLGDWFVKLNESIKKSEFFISITKDIKQGLASVADAIKAFLSVDTSGIEDVFEKLKARLAPLGTLLEGVGGVLVWIASAFKETLPIVYRFGEAVGNALTVLKEKLIVAFKSSDVNSFFDVINSILGTGVLVQFYKWFGKLNSISFSWDFIDILDTVRGSLMAYQAQLSANTLLKIAGAIAILAASLVILSLVDPEKLTNALLAMSLLFAQLGIAMSMFREKFKGPGMMTMASYAAMILGMSTAILILAGAVFMLAQLDWDQVSRGLLSVGALIGMLVGSAKLLSTGQQAMIKGAFGFVIFAAAINVLTSAVKKLGELDLEELKKGLLGVGVLLAELSVFMKFTQMGGMGPSAGAGVLLMAAGVYILASAIERLGAIDPDKLTIGLMGMAALLTELIVFIKLTSGSQGIIQTAIGMVILGGALLIMTAALKSMGNMTWDEIGRGLTVLAGSLLILVAAMRFMQTTIAGAAAMVIMSVGLIMLAGALKIFGSMPLEEIGKSLLAMAGSFIILGVAALVLSPLIGVIVALSGAIALLGVGMLAVGAGLLLFSTGLAALTVVGTAGAAALILIFSSVISLVPLLFSRLGMGIVNIIVLLGDSAPLIAEAVGSILHAILNMVVDMIPAIVNGFYILLTNILSVIIEAAPALVEAGMTLITSLLIGIGNKIPEVVDAAFKLVINFINGMADAIRENTPVLMTAIANLTTAIIEGLVGGLFGGVGLVGEAIIDLGKSALDGLKNFLGIRSPSKEFRALGEYSSQGFADGIGSETDAITASLLTMSEKALLVLAEKSPEFKKAGYDTAISISQGLKQGIASAITTMRLLINQALAEINASRNNFKMAGKNMVSGFVQGIEEDIWRAARAAAEMAAAAMRAARSKLDIRSPSKVFMEMGKHVDQGFAQGITQHSGVAETAVEDMGDSVIKTLSDTFSKISSFVAADMDMAPTIKPVIDLTDVENGNRQLRSLFGTTGLNVGVVARKAALSLPIEQDPKSPQPEPLPESKPSYSFIQNNYSPKPLSRIDIYRQTRNQFSAAKGLVEST